MKKNWIEKDLSSFTVQPNLINYSHERDNFDWKAVSQQFDGLSSGGLNIAHEAIDRHANGHLATKTALLWLGKNGERESFTFADMKKQTAKFANVLTTLGLLKGERVFTLSTRLPELYIAAIGILKNRNVLCPLFSQFGPEPILQRMQRGDARALLTTKTLYEKKIRPMLDQLPELRFILLIDADKDESEQVRSLKKLMDAASDTYEILPTDPEDMSILHFTSGTTGMPKGVVHVHKAAYTHWTSGKYVLDFHPDDIYWCPADPGWVTGTSYGLSNPLLHCMTTVVDQAEFAAIRWSSKPPNASVRLWYPAPTVNPRPTCCDLTST